VLSIVIESSATKYLIFAGSDLLLLYYTNKHHKQCTSIINYAGYNLAKRMSLCLSLVLLLSAGDEEIATP